MNVKIMTVKNNPLNKCYIYLLHIVKREKKCQCHVITDRTLMTSNELLLIKKITIITLL